MNLDSLEAMASEIEKEIVLCEKDLKKVGSLAIKTQSLLNLLSKEDATNRAVNILIIKANSYQNKAKELCERRAKEKQELENELVESKIRQKKITEISDTGVEQNFFVEQTSRLEDFISISMDSIESLRRQSVLVNNINNKLRQGAIRLGISTETLSKIETRFAEDKSLFLILLCLFIILVILLKFIF
ncbi:hypothetical protein GINT2_000217 [Glugoides intestinalis]